VRGGRVTDIIRGNNENVHHNKQKKDFGYKIFRAPPKFTNRADFCAYSYVDGVFKDRKLASILSISCFSPSIFAVFFCCTSKGTR
jgi:hypothetical protein